MLFRNRSKSIFHQLSYNNLGRVYLGQTRYEEAEKWFRKQVDVNPLDKYAHANLGLMFVEAQKYQQAIPELTQAASLTPNSPDPQVRLGEAYLNLGQDESAMAAFEKAVQISATPAVWNNIAYQLSKKQSHLDVARRYSESAVTSTEASLRNASLDQLSRRDLLSTSALARYWGYFGLG
jgi:tetratricopeptide (TPR) repeat protein